ncbi:ribonuclease P protein component [Alicyclobacillus cellulosilyticus]|uniref:Ribonuclease P protein component n=1 Tax=Alicyclobacillus cellulosilyticus TaxID=1003997 RepID=A0A917NEF0_9BACL|nr:ribonuclease P protein component [Alicyclobacillus cellulosilyticus]GGI95034.1 ribonuclease P protein component [Alicyclobacillus cellulosilyticus]
MKARHRLKDNRDFRRVFQRGKSVATGRLVLYWHENRLTTFRAGFSISKKIGKAVVRNRLKRLLRACFLELGPKLENTPVDFVVVCRQGSADASYHELLSDLRKLLRRAKFMV